MDNELTDINNLDFLAKMHTLETQNKALEDLCKSSMERCNLAMSMLAKLMEVNKQLSEANERKRKLAQEYAALYSARFTEAAKSRDALIMLGHGNEVMHNMKVYDELALELGKWRALAGVA